MRIDKKQKPCPGEPDCLEISLRFLRPKVELRKKIAVSIQLPNGHRLHVITTGRRFFLA